MAWAGTRGSSGDELVQGGRAYRLDLELSGAGLPVGVGRMLRLRDAHSAGTSLLIRRAPTSNVSAEATMHPNAKAS